MTKKQFEKPDIFLFIAAAFTLILIVTIAIFSIGFISTSLYKALSPEEKSSIAVSFDIAGYNALGLQ